MSTPLIEEALQVALRAHQGQQRKTDGSPYVAHPIMVAMLLQQHGFDEAVVAAALVHDVLEDTPVGETELRALLGDTVVGYVLGVSEDKSLPWRDRKELYIEAVAVAPEPVKAISVADKIHNVGSMIAYHAEHGAELWKKFSRGREETVWFQRALCDRLKDSWHHPLLEEYEKLVSQLEVIQ